MGSLSPPGVQTSPEGFWVTPFDPDLPAPELGFDLHLGQTPKRAFVFSCVKAPRPARIPAFPLAPEPLGNAGVLQVARQPMWLHLLLLGGGGYND